ncbi:MAG: polysaccharide biosynthesis/export family protein [Flavobacteriales bacterium]|nr:polysaccharide biosynthesis/export family protein [Flavobacteriales bacterium]MBP9079864.1 polysaccharide biosynthesis/export family protein [Flavobacteriales bacterium]
MGKLSIVLGLAALMFTGCAINRDIMFKTPRDYQFDTASDTLDRQFKIQPDDVLSFRMYANDGFKMVDMVNEENLSMTSANRIQFSYLVHPDGQAKLPVVGYVPVAGLSIREAEMALEQRYSTYYQKPFVLLSVSNRRVVVFPGGGGDAKVVMLENNNTSLLEVLARAGGIAKRGDARRVKLFRKDGEQRKIFEFDLSDIDNLKYADMVMQADDVVYVQPNAEIARGILQEVTPLITLLTSAVLVLGIIQTFK